jgi:hypothetical protein
MTPQELNVRNAQFWLLQSELLDDRISDATLFRIATADLNSEIARGVSIKSQKTLEAALADAAHHRSIYRGELSRMGGRARKGDALQNLIDKILEARPKISRQQLQYALEGPDGAGVVTHIDKTFEALSGVRQIHFTEEDGRPKLARLSGLKDRLSRARRKTKSR